ncbi:glycosyltransferase [Flavobacterium sp. NRK F10]|uniref:glycosyltransferase family 2 protein n=1 Tax=Flavobacterium sp. NRK F10 TaxID=2954931 RepID=UPI0020902141|nr:glycosyltransferase [Flavobacterium sp. NRK F10]MCO6174190.1 glycosyltransferase [Flavobacterium sp. NRK F10]
MEKPLVSVCLPIYNGEKYLEEALHSIKEQTYSNIEVVISDDNSKDNSRNIVERFKTSVNFPVFIYQHEPQGIGANWNNSVKKANGEFIKFLFQDDLLEPACIEEMVHLALQDKAIGLVFCKRKFIHDQTNPQHIEWLERSGSLHQTWKSADFEKNRIMTGRKLLNDENLLQSPVNKIGEPTAVLIRKECFEKVGYFDTRLKQILDYEYWFRIFKKYHIAFVDKELVTFRLHDQQATAVNQRKAVDESEQIRRIVYKNYFWQIHPYYRKNFFLRYNFFGKVLKKVTRMLKRLK